MHELEILAKQKLERWYGLPDSYSQAKEITALLFDGRLNNMLDEMADRFHNGPGRQIYTERQRALVNLILINYDPAKGSKQTHIALIRGSYVAKDELGAWNTCRDRIHAHVTVDEGEDIANRLLRGLYR